MGRPIGGSAKKDNNDKSLPSNTVSTTNDKVDNKDESDILDAINNALIDNMDNLGMWLKKIGENDPVKAMSLYLQLAEYKLPKQQRADSKTSGTNPIVINFEPSSKANVNVNTTQPPQQQKQPQRPFTNSSNNQTFNIHEFTRKLPNNKAG